MFPGPEWADLHDQVLKWGLASVSLIVSACRGNDSLEGLGPKGDNLFTEEELRVFEDVPVRARPVVLWCWILMLVAKLSDELCIAPGKYRDVAMECVAARNGISLIWTYLRTQLPFAYVHLVTFLVNLNNLVVSVKCGMVLGMAIQAHSWSQCVNQILFLFIVPPLYQGLLGISHVIHDPFGEDLLDFPVMAFQEYTNESAVTVTGAGYKCPALRQSWGPPIADGADGQNLIDKEVEKLAKDTSPEQLRDTVNQMDQVLSAQLKSKDDLIGSLRGQVGGLEASIAAMNNRIQSMEGRLLQSAMNNNAQSASANAGWCSAPVLARRDPAVPPAATLLQ